MLKLPCVRHMVAVLLRGVRNVLLGGVLTGVLLGGRSVLLGGVGTGLDEACKWVTHQLSHPMCASYLHSARALPVFILHVHLHVHFRSTH